MILLIIKKQSDSYEDVHAYYIINIMYSDKITSKTGRIWINKVEVFTMTDKEFKHLKRADLIEIIYALQKNEQQLQSQLAEAQARLDRREIKIAEAGSIAEAVVGLSGLFETAQAAADEYLAQIHAMDSGKAMERFAQMEEAAKAASEQILRQAREEAQAMREEAQAEIQRKWKHYYARRESLGAPEGGAEP